MTARCPFQGAAANIVYFSGNRGEAGQEVPAESFTAISIPVFQSADNRRYVVGVGANHWSPTPAVAALNRPGRSPTSSVMGRVRGKDEVASGRPGGGWAAGLLSTTGLPDT